jgi:hypothetical protein
MAREHLKLELERRELPVPEAFTVRKIGEPHEDTHMWDDCVVDY